MSPDSSTSVLRSGKAPEDFGIINQRGLSRKVSSSLGIYALSSKPWTSSTFLMLFRQA